MFLPAIFCDIAAEQWSSQAIYDRPCIHPQTHEPTAMVSICGQIIRTTLRRSISNNKIWVHSAPRRAATCQQTRSYALVPARYRPYLCLASWYHTLIGWSNVSVGIQHLRRRTSKRSRTQSNLLLVDRHTSVLYGVHCWVVLELDRPSKLIS